MKKVKILFVTILALFLTVGCGNTMNTPTKKVEQFLGKYQTQDKDVLQQLDDVITSTLTLVDTQRDDYRDLMKKQYQNMSYKIKEEVEDGNTASVTAEIEVYDYGRALSESDAYLISNRDEFTDENDVVDTQKFWDYKIKQMKDVKDKVKYTITFNLTKVNDKWELNDISDTDRQKLHGLYY